MEVQVADSSSGSENGSKDSLFDDDCEDGPAVSPLMLLLLLLAFSKAVEEP